MNKSSEHRNDIIPEQDPGFFGLGIAPKILEILEKVKFKTPTPIQRKAIPLAIEGKDVIGIAQTGTGKTHAFGIPMIQNLAQKDGFAVVLAPTRELAMQINEALRPMAFAFGMRTVCLIGGMPMRPQEEILRRRPRIVIATPGRFIDHMERGNLIINKVVMLIVDEADRMLDMGFAPQIDMILKGVPRERQTMLFSATMPVEIMRMVNNYMHLPVQVEMAPSGTMAENITQELYIVKKEMKLNLLDKVLAQYHGSALLFVRTKYSARRITRDLHNMGHRAAEIHSDKTMAQRRDALEGFKFGRYRILVATDIASRGIDVTKIELVINYDLPEDVENYVHRVGRTGRAGCKGHAISFAEPDQHYTVKSIERLIKKQLPVAKHPEVPAEEFYSSRPFNPPGRRGGAGFKRHYGASRSRFRR